MPKPILYKAKTNYYEAIIQLRPYDDEVFDFIIAEVEKREPIFIQRVEKLKTGIDIYISSQAFARRIGVQLRKKFKGEMKITRKLHTQHRLTSKLLYRATVLFRKAPDEDKD
jgi:NMD protein affecting ribosome stability and mRNA decay